MSITLNILIFCWIACIGKSTTKPGVGGDATGGPGSPAVDNKPEQSTPVPTSATSQHSVISSETTLTTTTTTPTTPTTTPSTTTSTTTTTPTKHKPKKTGGASKLCLLLKKTGSPLPSGCTSGGMGVWN